MKLNFKREQKENIAGYLFVAPLILGLLVFTLVPVLLSFFYSFTSFNNINPPELLKDINGNIRLFGNYIDMFSDKSFLNSIWVTAKFTLISVFLSMILSFLLALALNIKARSIKFFRVLFYLPCIIPSVATAAIWQDMFNPTYIGIVNKIISLVGLGPSKWFSSVDTAFNSMILLSLWGIGGGMLIWISAFNSVNVSCYEAAEIEGASKFQQLILVTLPIISPVIFYNLIMNVIGALQSFGSAYLLTGGGPFEATNFLALNIYKEGISYFRMGYACAQAWFLFFVIIVLTIIIFKTSSWVFYEDESK